MTTTSRFAPLLRIMAALAALGASPHIVDRRWTVTDSALPAAAAAGRQAAVDVAGAERFVDSATAEIVAILLDDDLRLSLACQTRSQTLVDLQGVWHADHKMQAGLRIVDAPTSRTGCNTTCTRRDGGSVLHLARWMPRHLWKEARGRGQTERHAFRASLRRLGPHAGVREEPIETEHVAGGAHARSSKLQPWLLRVDSAGAMVHEAAFIGAERSNEDSDYAIAFRSSTCATTKPRAAESTTRKLACIRGPPTVPPAARGARRRSMCLTHSARPSGMSIQGDMPMHHQRSLPMTHEAALEALWEHFSERSRNEVIALYAEIIGRSVKPPAPSEKEEETQREDSDR